MTAGLENERSPAAWFFILDGLQTVYHVFRHLDSPTILVKRCFGSLAFRTRSFSVQEQDGFIFHEFQAHLVPGLDVTLDEMSWWYGQIDRGSYGWYAPTLMESAC